MGYSLPGLRPFVCGGQEVAIRDASKFLFCLCLLARYDLIAHIEAAQSRFRFTEDI
jgi:hypothetical protein